MHVVDWRLASGEIDGTLPCQDMRLRDGLLYDALRPIFFAGAPESFVVERVFYKVLSSSARWSITSYAIATNKMVPRLVVLVSTAFATCVQAVTLTVSTTGGNASSPNLYGIMFEDINNSGDGGIHGQLLQNNGFQGVNPGLKAWSAVGRA